MEWHGFISRGASATAIDLQANKPMTTCELGLYLSDIGTFGVMLGDGRTAADTGSYCRLVIDLQGLQILADFLPLDLGSTDMTV